MQGINKIASKLLTKVMHHIIRFCYPYFKDIELEKQLIADAKLKSEFKSIDKNSYLGEYPLICGAEFITIGKKFYSKRFTRIEALAEFANVRYIPEIIIGDYVRMGDLCHIGAVESITIGNYCLIGSKTIITDHYHGNTNLSHNDNPRYFAQLISKAVKIGNNVWLGDNVSIMPGVTLGDNVIVGANSVVTHSFPANSVIAGCPARLIKTL